MVENKGVKMYCRGCRKIVDVYEAYREEKVFPEENPEFDILTWCCAICHAPVIEVSELRKA